MKLFDYSELIKVIENVELREQKEKDMALTNLKERYKELKKTLINSGIFDDWNRLKQLCAKADIRLCVSHQGNKSMGRIINHPDDFKYCKEYRDNGLFCECMSSGSSWSDYFGFNYETDKSFNWHITHNTSYHGFEWFKTEDEEYKTKISLLETFKNTYEDYRDFQLKKIEEKFKSRIKPEDIKGGDKMILSTFVKIGENREQAYISHIDFELGFASPILRNIITFKEFCKELDLGYGKSDYVQIARLYEDEQGNIWYDNEYTH
jgi:hypothetical protein